MVMKDDVRELFHTWPDEAEDPALDQLIVDIHHDKVVKGFWDLKRNEKKRKVNVEAVVESESPAKKPKVHKVSRNKELNSSEGDAYKKNKKNKESVVVVEDDVEEEVSIRRVVNMVSELNARVHLVHTNMESMSSNMEKVIVYSIEEKMNAKFRSIEMELQKFKEQMNAIGVGQAGENVGDGRSDFKIKDRCIDRPA